MPRHNNYPKVKYKGTYYFLFDRTEGEAYIGTQPANKFPVSIEEIELL